ncbi:hypothetical protein TS85_13770 [Sphingomonas hengshuiensis]|uniref:Uncharacterized protein n=1 Tax=Sphingomonas hengshuiensis TaxID=1609977 RepID=A0A7U4J9A1_9SPHN|nr:hypothetical protein TS85_13770 [Sphingomonas hengshuiensis]
MKKGDGAFLPFVGEYLAEGDARGVVDADMDELPADPRLLDCRSPVIRWPTRSKRPSFFDVDVDAFAGVLTLITADRFGGFKIAQPAEAEPREYPADGGWRDADGDGDLLAGDALTAQRGDLLSDGGRCRLTQPVRA